MGRVDQDQKPSNSNSNSKIKRSQPAAAPAGGCDRLILIVPMLCVGTIIQQARHWLLRELSPVKGAAMREVSCSKKRYMSDLSLGACQD